MKLDIMRAAVRFKFDQHPALIDLLLSTGEEEIIEQTTNDYYWGCGIEGGGQNWLGKILMELRTLYRGKRDQVG